MLNSDEPTNDMLKEEINGICRRYIIQSLCLVAVLTLIATLLTKLTNIDGLMTPSYVALGYAVVVECADALIWGKVKQADADALPTFYTAVSGFRMLLALATLVVCYLVVGRDAMREYCLVFVCYYMAIVAHHSIFFTRISNSHTSCDNENK